MKRHILSYSQNPYCWAVIDSGYNCSVIDTWPDISECKHMTSKGFHKYSFQQSQSDTFDDFVGKHTAWRDLYNWSQTHFVDWAKDIVSACRFPLVLPKKISTKMEISLVPADCGALTPHRDTKKKIATAILYCGGFHAGTNILNSSDPNSVHCHVDFSPGKMLFFLRNEKSWHSVGPLCGPPGEFRKTVSFNIMNK